MNTNKKILVSDYDQTFYLNDEDIEINKKAVDSSIVDKNNQSEFFAIREGLLNCGRIVGYFMLLLAGISGNQIVLNVIMILLTLSILATGLNIKKIEKFEK